VLHVAANCCHEQDVLKLLQNGADINARNRRGRTPLHTASHYGNVEVVGILLDWEADVLVQDDDGNTPLHLSRDHRIARMLLEAGCTPNIVNADGRTALIDSVDRGDTATVKLLLRFKADVLFRELKHHQTALHLAVRKGHYQIVMELCKSEEIENLVLLTDRNENNCLHFAVSRDRKNGFRLVDYLIKHGAEVNKVNARLQTPLVVHIMTTRQTDPAITELFLSRGADGNVSLADGSTLLHVAVERELIDIGCALIKYGSSLNQPDAKGRLVVDVANKKYLKKLFSAITLPPTWIEEKARRACMLCNSGFKFAARKHHCRHCGRVCCSDCSSFTVEMFRFPKDFPGRAATGKAAKEPQRVCRTCHAVFKMRTAQKESKSGFMARVLGYEWDEVTEMH
jgi:myosin-5